MRALVVGCGSIGERHIANLRSLTRDQIAVCDVDERKLEYVRKKHGIDTYVSLDEALSKGQDCVLVCTPTNSHIAIATRALRANCHVFVEKPLSDRMDGIDELLGLANAKKKTVSVGFNMRFDKSLRKMKEWLDAKRIGNIVTAGVHFGYSFLRRKVDSDYRQDYAGQVSMGGGVILDAIHEIDYLIWLVGDVEELFCYSGRLSGLHMDVEDTAEMLLKFRNGAIGSIHLDFVQLPYCRCARIVGREGTIEWNFGTIERDFDDSVASLYDGERGQWETYRGNVGRNAMYLEEMRHLIACVEGKEKPAVDGELGKKVLEVALAAKESSREARIVRIGETCKDSGFWRNSPASL